MKNHVTQSELQGGAGFGEFFLPGEHIASASDASGNGCTVYFGSVEASVSEPGGILNIPVGMEMFTGWIFVNGKWYYLSPGSGLPVWVQNEKGEWIYGGTGRAMGSMYADEKTPDGYTVDASGAWTVNGVVQTKIIAN